MASEIRAKAVSIAGHFGYGTDDSEDIAQDVMLRLWSLHEQLTDATHLKASAVITAKLTEISLLKSYCGKAFFYSSYNKITVAVSVRPV